MYAAATVDLNQWIAMAVTALTSKNVAGKLTTVTHVHFAPRHKDHSLVLVRRATMGMD